MWSEISAVPLAGTWYRHVPAEAPPLPGHPAPDGRWQRGQQLAGLYLAQERDTVWAEWYRALAELGEPPDARLPRDLWRFSIDLQRVADLSCPDKLRGVGLPDPEPDRAQWPRFQDMGVQLAAEEYEGVLFQSSARPGGLCVCVFGQGTSFPGAKTIGEAHRIAAAPTPPRGMRT